MKSRLCVLVLFPFWVLVLGLGIRSALCYESTPGLVTSPPQTLLSTGKIVKMSSLPTLLMFAHPRCPCTRASLSELAHLLAHCRGKVATTILFYTPHNAESNWSSTDLWRSAVSIPGVTVRNDWDGTEAKRLHAETSGETLLYGASGKLLFHGGITAGRGHIGESIGQTTLETILMFGQKIGETTPVYGCSLSRSSLGTNKMQKAGNPSCRP